jgi:large subunit ribosomal protein L22
MESKAILRYARVTPRKVRRVTKLIGGKTASEAEIMLKFMPYRAAGLVLSTLKSAMANAQVKDVADPEQMIIFKIFVDQGPVMKRMMPRAMGRANVIKKRSSHITLVLKEPEPLKDAGKKL